MHASEIDKEKLTTLRRWADGLLLDERTEVAAAGRAILMLVVEVERLREVLADALAPPPPAAELEEPSPAADVKERGDFAAALRRRLTRESGELRL